MNPVAFVRRRPVTTLMMVVALAGAAVFGLYKMRVDIPALQTTKIYASLDGVAARLEQSFGKGKSASGEENAEEEHKIVVTSPEKKNVVISRKYVCQIHSQKYIEVCALDNGYLEKILIREGQTVKKGDLLFKILPVLYKAKLDSKEAEAKLAALEVDYSVKLSAKGVVSENEVALKRAKLLRARAEADLAKAEFDFTNVTARFDGIVDRQLKQLGSLVKEGDILTTLSDNSVMWVYFNVPEARYLEYMAVKGQREEDEKIELMLADGTMFKHTAKIGAIEAIFNNETGNIHFRADFPNTEGLLRHGQTGTVVMHYTLKDAIVIPQRATFEILAKRYAYVVSNEDDKTKVKDKDDDNKDKDEHEDADKDEHKDDDNKDKNEHKDPDKDKDEHLQHGVVRQREIVIQNELDDVFVIQKGLEVGDRIILEGIRQVRDGDKVEYEFLAPEKALDHLKYHAE